VVQRNNFVITIFRDPTSFWNTYDKKKDAITNPNVKVFGLHREAVGRIDDDYKNNLMTLYSNFYDKKTCDMIKSLLYHAPRSGCGCGSTFST
jgi:hypothetical protein